MRKKILLISVLLGVCSCRTVSTDRTNAKDKPLPHHAVQNLFAGEVFATANLEARSGSQAFGKVWFIKNNNGIQVVALVDNVSAGFHGIHIHEKGDCSAADASSAGGHFNPTHLNHGEPDPKLHHVGDLGNIVVGSNGHGILNLAIPSSRFNPDFTDWKNIVGKSVVLHSGEDDLMGQPTGNSGSRIACAVITAAQ